MLLTAIAGGHPADRPDRDRVDHLQRAVQPGPAVRLGRPRQRRPGRLEHRHHRRSSTRPATSGSTSSRAHHDRYERAAEFVEVACKLWDSWDDDAALGDKEARRLGRLDRVHPIDHVGEYFSVARAAQRAAVAAGRIRCWCRPGSSEDGKDLAARYAEAVFTAQQTLEDAQAFYADLKRRAAAVGPRPRRRSRSCPGIVPGHRRDRGRGAGAGGRARPADHARVRPRAAGQDAPRRPRRPAAGPRAARPTCPTRTRSRAPRAATR